MVTLCLRSLPTFAEYFRVVSLGSSNKNTGLYLFDLSQGANIINTASHDNHTDSTFEKTIKLVTMGMANASLKSCE
jgi:hypothetical protein